MHLVAHPATTGQAGGCRYSTHYGRMACAAAAGAAAATAAAQQRKEALDGPSHDTEADTAGNQSRLRWWQDPTQVRGNQISGPCRNSGYWCVPRHLQQTGIQGQPGSCAALCALVLCGLSKTLTWSSGWAALGPYKAMTCSSHGCP